MAMPDRLPRPERVAEKVEGLGQEIAPPVDVLAVDKLRLLRVQYQPAGREPGLQVNRPCAPRRYSGPCGFSRLDVSLGIGTTGSHVPYKSLVRLRAAYMPDAARAVIRTPPALIPGDGSAPGFDIV